MSLPVLVISGHELVLARAGEIVLREPCLAHLGGREIVFGRAAEARARLAPRQIEDRYWSNLNDSPLSVPHRRAGTAADLAFLQLEGLLSRVNLREPVLLAVNAGFQREQLAVLLGMFSHLPVSAVGLVNSAVAALSDAAAGRYRVLEPTRHGVVVSDVDVAEDGHEVVLVDAALRTESGLVGYLDACAEAICAAFVQATRFDPMASLESEQELFDLLPQWLDALGRGARIEAVLPNAGNEYVLHLGPDDLPFDRLRLSQILAAMNTPERQMVVTENAVSLPGLCAGLPTARQCTLAAVLEGVERNLGHIRHDPPALPWVRRLPWAAEVDIVLTEPTASIGVDAEAAPADESTAEQPKAGAAPAEAPPSEMPVAEPPLEEPSLEQSPSVGFTQPDTPVAVSPSAGSTRAQALGPHSVAGRSTQENLPQTEPVVGDSRQGEVFEAALPLAAEPLDAARASHMLVGNRAFALPAYGDVYVSSAGEVGVAARAGGLRLSLSPTAVNAAPLIDSVWLDGRRLTEPLDVMPGAVLEVGAHPCRLFIMAELPTQRD